MEAESAVVLVTAAHFHPQSKPWQTLLGASFRPVLSAAVGQPGGGTDLVAEINETHAAAVLGVAALDRAAFRKASSLRHIARRGVGVDDLDLDAANDFGVVVTITPGLTARSVAEHAIALMFAVAKRLTEGDVGVRVGASRPRLTTELQGKTLGLVGFGRIGRHVCRIANGLDMRVLVYDPAISGAAPRQPIAARAQSELIYDTVSLEDLLRRADVVSLHATGTSAVMPLIGARELDLCRPGAILINTARGSLVDEPALAAALQSGHVAGAGLDVWSDEREAPKCLASMNAVVLTPHMASHSRDALQRANQAAADAVVDVAVGRVIPSELVVTPRAWETRMSRAGRWSTVGAMNARVGSVASPQSQMMGEQ